ncbi:MAG: folate-binding protein YgfZ [Thiobacillaceae bacterium]|jgi:folate-binding protein YgfZ|nr:folate-binding protein YgfZ [Hydrogenophilales bacterium]MBP8901428.1 folate-binding protein YgfZ [Thiobacillaceae bacterium]MBP9914771.1 folate-binding protein YgfZ [Thiobacillaceae bacterium]
MSTWTDFLSTRGAKVENGVVIDFGDPPGELAACKGETVVADLSHFGLIGFSGEEAQTFLHGQITNDLRGLRENAAVFAGYLSPKGRMLANFLVMKRGGDVLVMLPESLRESIQKRLSMFILRSKVKARNADAEWVRLGVNGAEAAAAVAEILGVAVAEGMMAVSQGEQAFALRLGDGRFDLFIAPDAAPAAWEKLVARARPVGTPAWDWLMVRAGVPVVLPQTQDHFVPQMANMEILGGVSFNKGCYPGQEIVARSQYLGKVKRRLHLAHLDAEARPGDELFAPDPADQSAGLIANAAPAPEGGWDVLAVVLNPSVEAGEVRLKSRDGAKLSFKPLPYPVA